MEGGGRMYGSEETVELSPFVRMGRHQGQRGSPGRQGQFNKVDGVWIFLISRQSWTAVGA